MGEKLTANGSGELGLQGMRPSAQVMEVEILLESGRQQHHGVRGQQRRMGEGWMRAQGRRCMCAGGLGNGGDVVCCCRPWKEKDMRRLVGCRGLCAGHGEEALLGLGVCVDGGGGWMWKMEMGISD